MTFPATRSTILLAVFLLVPRAMGSDIFVDNLAGDDRSDGRSRLRSRNGTGPVRTLDRAMRVANTGDTINIINNNVPYYGSLNLTGGKHSGNNVVPFRIVGNGATISGARKVATSAWREHSGDVWSIEPPKKGRYMLLRDGEPVARYATAFDSPFPEGLPEGQFAVCRGRIFYRAAKRALLSENEFAIAQGTSGISLWGVRYVIIQDLKVQHFRIDGVNAHDLCRNVMFDRVTAVSNGRAGVTVKGSSQIVMRQCNVTANLEHSILVEESGGADVQNSTVDVEPTRPGAKKDQ